MPTGTARWLVALGVSLVLIGLLTGLAAPTLTNPRMGLSSHLAALSGGTLLIALGAAWGHVRLPARQDRWALALNGYGSVANWLATLLAAVWGAGSPMMPIAAGVHRAAAWQEGLISALLISLSLTLIGGIALTLKGLLAPAPRP